MFFLPFLLFLFVSCGIENTLYIKEPTEVKVSYDFYKVPVITFYGYNQEELDGNYLFMGYDLYYYFDAGSTHRRARVLNSTPYLKKDDTTAARNKNLITALDMRGTRKIYENFSDSSMLNIYSYITFPVTESIIKDILTEANTNNVEIYFDNKTANDGDFSNPYVSSHERKVYIDNIYPAYEEYPTDWDKLEGGFLGFFDYEYYKKNEIRAFKDDGDEYIYRGYFYLKAKGVENFTSTSFVTTLLESNSSSTVQVDFVVKKSR